MQFFLLQCKCQHIFLSSRQIRFCQLQNALDFVYFELDDVDGLLLRNLTTEQAFCEIGKPVVPRSCVQRLLGYLCWHSFLLVVALLQLG